MCASVAAITRYSEATSRFRFSINPRYSRYLSVMKEIGRSRMSSSCLRIRCRSRSSGPSKLGSSIRKLGSRASGASGASGRRDGAGLAHRSGTMRWYAPQCQSLRASLRASITASTCPFTFTFGKRLMTLPSGPISTVERMIPIDFLP